VDQDNNNDDDRKVSR